MKTKLTFLFLAAAAISLSLGSCNDGSKNGGDPGPYMSGLGKNSGTPSGTVFNLPTGITIEGDIRGGYDFSAAASGYFKKEIISLPAAVGTRASYSDYVPYGSGFFVNLYIKFKNSRSSDVILEIPAGLIFISVSGTYQHGFVLQKALIPIPANKEVYALIYSYCLNADRHASDETEKYTLGPVTDHPLLLQIVDIMRNKKVPSNTTESSTILSIQNIIWGVTDHGYDYSKGLPKEDRDYLNSLP